MSKAKYLWVKTKEKPPIFLSNNGLYKFIETRPSGDYWIPEMGGEKLRK